MSNKVKLPVIETLTGSLSFAAKRFPTVLKVALLPTLVLMVPTLYIMATAVMNLLDHLPALMEFDANNEVSEDQVEDIFRMVLPVYKAMLLTLPLQLLFSAMVAVPLTRSIVLDEKPGFFRLDGVVWRYFFGQIIAVFLFSGIMLAIFGAAAAAIAVLENAGVDEVAFIAVGLFAFCLAIFIMVRLSLFMVEIAVSGKFGVRAAFAVTKGNVWRLIGAGLLFLILLLAIEIAFEIIFYLFGAFALTSNLEDLKGAAEAEDLGLMIEAIKTTIISPVGGVFAAVVSVYFLFMTGLQTAFPAMLYKKMGGGE